MQELKFRASFSSHLSAKSTKLCFILFFFVTKAYSSCFSSIGSSDICSSCYITDYISNDNICLEKDPNKILLSREVFMDPSTDCDTGCTTADNTTYSSLYWSLRKEQEKAQEYFFSKITVYLLGNNITFGHELIEDDSLSNPILRRINTEIVIKPWPCRFHPIK